mgnify:CR=1 FL=1
MLIVLMLYYILNGLVYCLDTSAYLLQRALEVETSDPLPLIEALYWLESAYAIDSMNTSTAQRLRHQYHTHSTAAHSITASIWGVLSNTTSADTTFLQHQQEQQDSVRVASNLLKNAGLAYVHLVRNAPITSAILPLPQKDVLLTIATELLYWPVKEK